VPYNNDYILASTAMAKRLTACHALDEDDAWALSDHCPVIAHFDI
jgi:exonuclease III